MFPTRWGAGMKQFTFSQQWEDGTLGPPKHFNYEEAQRIFATLPVDRLGFTDDKGNIRNDTITITEAKALTRATLDALFQAWTQLRSIVARHETTLTKRWMKKTSNQRKEVLSKVWPEMPPMHRPDFEVLRNRDRSDRRKINLVTDFALRFPHINMVDLARPQPLLLMLASRSQELPSTFTNVDRNSIRVGIISNMLVPGYLAGYSMYLNGEGNETYGRLVSWREDRQAAWRYVNGIAPDPGMGLLILDIQRDIVQFLVRCSAAILHDITIVDINMSTLGSFPQSLARVETLSSRIVVNQESTPTALALEAPYRAPDAFDFGRLKSLVEAKRKAVQDHFLLLREDPGYFAGLIQEAFGQTLEAIMNPKLSTQPRALSETSRDWAISRVLMTACRDALMWDTISCLLDELIAMHAEHSGQLDLGKTPPGAYLKAFSRLGLYLGKAVVSHLDCFSHYISAVPAFRGYMMIKSQMAGHGQIYLKTEPDDYLFWLFQQFDLSTKGVDQICNLPSILQELDLLITTDELQRNRLTPCLLTLISDLAVIAEMQYQMILSTCNDYTMSAYTQDEDLAWESDHMASLNILRDTFQTFSGFAGHVADLRVFYYPTHKPRTATTTAKMRSAEQALDNLWKSVDDYFLHKAGISLQELEGNKIHYRDIRRTPVWTEPQSCSHERQDDMNVSVAQRILEERTEATINPSIPILARQKAKTRGLPAHHLQIETPVMKLSMEHNVTNDEEQQLLETKLLVKKKAFNTFAALFGKPVANTLPGELPWSDFKKAMVNIGFSAEKLQGSAWLFRPFGLGLANNTRITSIIFHQPHPESKLSMEQARRIARRLNRNFGWTNETFVPENITEEDNTEPASC